MATTLAALAPDVALYVLGCAQPTIEKALLRAAQQLCEDAWVWTETLDPEPVLAVSLPLELVPSEGQFLGVARLTADGAVLPPATPLQLRDVATPANSTPVCYEADAVGRVMLFPKPATSVSVEAVIAVKPKATATSLHDDIAVPWRQALVDHALSTIKMIPSQPFTDPAGAAVHLRLYNAAMQRAKQVGWFGSAQQGVRVTPHEFI